MPLLDLGGRRWLLPDIYWALEEHIYEKIAPIDVNISIFHLFVQIDNIAFLALVQALNVVI